MRLKLDHLHFIDEETEPQQGAITLAKMTAAGRGVAGLVWLQTLTPQPPYHATAVGHIGHRQDREPGGQGAVHTHGDRGSRACAGPHIRSIGNFSVSPAIDLQVFSH